MNNTGLNANVVKTALDVVFFQKFNGDEVRGYATAETPAIFNQDSTDRASVITEIFKSTGLWEQTDESEDYKSGTFRTGNQQSFAVLKYTKKLPISEELFKDDQHSVVNRAVVDMGRKAKMTRDRNAFAIFRNAFTTTLTNDGAALISDSHTTLSGGTVDNKITAALTETSLNTAIQALIQQKEQDGTSAGCIPTVLLVPPALHKLAVEITGSTLRSATANNDLNYYSDKFSIMVMTSRYLGAAEGGSDTAWFLLADNHSITRWVREGVSTTLLDKQYSENGTYVYKGSYREVVGVMDYVGVYGSDGTTA